MDAASVGDEMNSCRIRSVSRSMGSASAIIWPPFGESARPRHDEIFMIRLPQATASGDFVVDHGPAGQISVVSGFSRTVVPVALAFRWESVHSASPNASMRPKIVRQPWFGGSKDLDHRAAVGRCQFRVPPIRLFPR